MLNKYDYLTISGSVAAALLIIKLMMENHELTTKSNAKNAAILKLVKMNLYYADKLDKSGVPLTEFDKIAVDDILN